MIFAACFLLGMFFALVVLHTAYTMLRSAMRQPLQRLKFYTSMWKAMPRDARMRALMEATGCLCPSCFAAAGEEHDRMCFIVSPRCSCSEEPEPHALHEDEDDGNTQHAREETP